MANAVKTPDQAGGAKAIVLAFHGGAGVLERSQMTPQFESVYRAGMACRLSAFSAATT
jgi:hypothetical protein